MPISSLLPRLTLVLLTGAACWSGTPAPAGPTPGGAVRVAGASAPGGARLEEVLAGKVPGLSIARRSDGSYVIRLRSSRATSDGEPLVLLDGVPLGGGSSAALAGIDPQDVERVEVIRDAASLSLYGVRGANGVIAITTRLR